MIGDEPLCRPARLSSLAAQIPCAVQCAKLPRPLISIGRVFIYSTVRGFSKEPDGHLLNLGWRLAPVLTAGSRVPALRPPELRPFHSAFGDCEG